MAQPKWKRVTKEKFEEFIRNYPRDLVEYEIMMCSPPICAYNDFELADYPNSEVAREFYGTDKVGDLWYMPESERYSVMENYEDVFEWFKQEKNNDQNNI